MAEAAGDESRLIVPLIHAAQIAVLANFWENFIRGIHGHLLEFCNHRCAGRAGRSTGCCRADAAEGIGGGETIIVSGVLIKDGSNSSESPALGRSAPPGRIHFYNP